MKNNKVKMCPRNLARIALFLMSVVFCSSCSDFYTIEEYPDNQLSTECLMIDILDIPDRSMDNGEVFWNSSYSIGSAVLNIDIDFFKHSIDQAYFIKARTIHGELDDIPNIIFDSDYADIKRTLNDEDPGWLQSVCRAYYAYFHPEDTSKESTETTFSYGHLKNIDTWVDDEEFFYHTYCGEKDGYSYYLFVGFRKDINMLNLELWPENPGEIIGDSDLNRMEWFNSEFGGVTFSDGRTIQEVMKDCKNRSFLDENSVIDITGGFIGQVIPVLISKNDLKFNTYGNNSRDQVYFFNDSIAKTQKYDESIVDGYCIHFSNLQNGGNYLKWTDMVEHILTYNDYTPDGNSGEILVHDDGVIACSLQVTYMIEEANPVKVLNLNEIKRKFSEDIVEKLIVDSVEGDVLLCNSVVFEYYGKVSENETDLKEYIPSWKYSIQLGDRKNYATVYQNAVDGTIIKIETCK